MVKEIQRGPIQFTAILNELGSYTNYSRGPKYHDDRPTGCRASKVASSQTVMPTLHTSLDVLPSDAKCIEVDLKEYIDILQG